MFPHILRFDHRELRNGHRANTITALALVEESRTENKGRACHLCVETGVDRTRTEEKEGRRPLGRDPAYGYWERPNDH